MRRSCREADGAVTCVLLSLQSADDRREAVRLRDGRLLAWQADGRGQAALSVLPGCVLLSHFAHPCLPILSLSLPQNAHSHRWTVFLRGLENEDLSYFISSVTFGLHSSFINPNRVLTSPPYEVTETGWGEFVITITVAFTHPALAAREPVASAQALPAAEHPADGAQAGDERDVRRAGVLLSLSAAVYDVLMSGPLQRFDSHPFSAWWTTKEFAREEQQQIVKLAGVLETVKERLHEGERHRLWRVEQEISQITGRMTG